MIHPVVTVLLSGSVSAFTGYLASRISQRQQQHHAEDVYRLAIATEIRTLHGRLARYDELLRTRVKAGRASGAQVLRGLLPDEATAVFSNNAASIGVFDTRTALRILRFYADVRTLQGHAHVISDMGPAAGEEEFVRHQHMLRHTRRRAHALVKRLRRRRGAPALLQRLTKWFGRGATSPSPARKRFRPP
jgi:Mg-chelatase subunit ChlI